MRRLFSTSLIVGLLLCGNFITATYGQSIASNSKANLSSGAPLKLSLPAKDGSLKFAVIGDTGTGSKKQYELADVMVQYRNIFPYEFVLMLGDNMYGGENAKDFEKKFSKVYQQLLANKVKFYASLGNHDLALQTNYENFNMNGKEYYRFKKGNVAFYSLNSNYMDKKQIKWLEDELAKDLSEWKVCFFHHPPYSSAKKHGSDEQLREVVEPIFVRYGVNVVLTGHDHVYERIRPQKGIYYFVSGAAGKLRSGDLDRSSSITAKAYDRDMHFMLLEVVDDQMYFQVITRTGETVDTGVMARQKKSS